MDLSHLVKWLCEQPAKQVGIDHQKGQLKKGYDADIVIWSPEEKFAVTKEGHKFRNKMSPYEGRELLGVVKKTLVRGHIIQEESKPVGKFIL